MRITPIFRLTDAEFGMLSGSIMPTTLLRDRSIVVEEPGSEQALAAAEAWRAETCTGLLYVLKFRAMDDTRLVHFGMWRDADAFRAAFPT